MSNNKYLVQSDWLTELPTMEKPVYCGDNDSWLGYLENHGAYLSHLASLPKICRCEGLKDGAIVEEGVGYRIEERSTGMISGGLRPIGEIGGKGLTHHTEPLAIPLHREQGEDNESEWDSVLIAIDQNNVVIHVGNPSTFRKDLIVEYAVSGYTLKTVSLKEYKKNYKLYELAPSPQSEQSGENRSKEEILDDCLGGRNRRYSPFDVAYRKQVYKAMEEYAARWQQSLPTEGRGVRWVKASNHGLPPIEVVTLEQLIEHGKNNGANIVNNMPWSFKYRNHPVTHENDGRYLVGCPSVDCTKDNPVIFFCNKVFNYWKNPGRLNILYKGLPDVLITGEGNWCFWSGRAVGHAGIDEYRGSHIRVKEEDLKFIEWLDESSPRLQEAAEWVRVEDGLPEFGANVLVIIDGVVRLGKFTGAGWYLFETIGIYSMSGDQTATHWRPLPSPPIK